MVFGKTNAEWNSTYRKKMKKITEWHKHFIIFPRALEDGRKVCLQTVERRYYISQYISYTTWEYRLPEKETERN